MRETTAARHTLRTRNPTRFHLLSNTAKPGLVSQNLGCHDTNLVIDAKLWATNA